MILGAGDTRWGATSEGGQQKVDDRWDDMFTRRACGLYDVPMEGRARMEEHLWGLAAFSGLFWKMVKNH